MIVIRNQSSPPNDSNRSPNNNGGGRIKQKLDPQSPTTPTRTRPPTKRSPRNSRSVNNHLSAPSYECLRKHVRRSLWLFIVVTLLVPFVCINFGVLVLFLKGPDVGSDYITIARSKPLWNQKQTDDHVPYRKPESPRPPREHVYTTLTDVERQQFNTMRNTFDELAVAGKLRPCRLDTDCWEKDGGEVTVQQQPQHPRIFLQNKLEEDRYWCGMRIMGKGGILDITDALEDCKHNVPFSYVYSNHPPQLSGEATPPVELMWNSGESDVAAVDTTEFPCSSPCRSYGYGTLINSINIKNTKWRITLSMEGEQYYNELEIKQGAYRENMFYATTSFRSEIPVPYFSWAEYNITDPEVDFDTAIKGASFIASNCNSRNNREELVSALINTTLRVDSLSMCLNNARMPPGINSDNKNDIMHSYLFHLAFENSRTDDYITEKLWGALQSGTLPIYFGAPNIKERVPRNSVIFVDDYETPRHLAEYLVKLTQDKVLYQSYHQWRHQPLDPVFVSAYNFTHIHSTCRMCRWAFAKRHGLGWNHPRQEVVEPFISHKTCRNKVGLVAHPFKEYWLMAGNDDEEGAERPAQVTSFDSTKTCDLSDNNRGVEIDGGALFRRIYDHDGVTDLLVEKKVEGTYILRLACPINATSLYETNLGPNQMIRWLQDSESRMTILASHNLNVSVLEPGIVQIPISSQTTATRVRVIVEDVDRFHRGTSKVTSYFGDLMSRDFFSPLEAHKGWNS
jgi:hypothetical protein